MEEKKEIVNFEELELKVIAQDNMMWKDWIEYMMSILEDTDTLVQVDEISDRICIITARNECTKMKILELKWVWKEKFLDIRSVRGDIKKMQLLHVPYMITREDIEQKLDDYGKIIRIEKEYYKPNKKILTGKRFITIKMQKPVPNFIDIKDRRIRVEYPGVKWMCSVCLSVDHRVRDCPNVKCYICELVGHRRPECPKNNEKDKSKEMEVVDKEMEISIEQEDVIEGGNMSRQESPKDKIVKELQEVYEELEKSIEQEKEIESEKNLDNSKIQEKEVKGKEGVKTRTQIKYRNKLLCEKGYVDDTHEVPEIFEVKWNGKNYKKTKEELKEELKKEGWLETDFKLWGAIIYHPYPTAQKDMK
ncbi:uncharacterized protein [Centruroides vittatus]|uniref:uncharacterized protein n=1 Tax=Centruroides vittatus TaxID=120091 RepID=UPI0035103D86